MTGETEAERKERPSVAERTLFISNYSRLVKRRPVDVVRNVGQTRLRVCGYDRMLVDGLGTVIVTEQILGGGVKGRIFLQIVGPVRDRNRVVGFLTSLDRVLFDG